MIHVFETNEDEYLEWVKANQAGFVVNDDKAKKVENYPMVHRATHKAISSEARTNYVTGKYYKVCSTDYQELEKWSKDKRCRSLTPCATCKPNNP